MYDDALGRLRERRVATGQRSNLVRSTSEVAALSRGVVRAAITDHELELAIRMGQYPAHLLPRAARPGPLLASPWVRGSPVPAYAGWADVMGLADRSWPVLGRLMGAHGLIYRATGGLIGHRFPGAPPVLLLDHVGTRSETARTTPLVYVRDGRDVIAVASKGGHPRHPGWYHNLRAHPETTVQIGCERRAVHARVADRDERARPWPKAVATYGGYRGYQQRTSREIPLVILEPRS